MKKPILFIMCIVLVFSFVPARAKPKPPPYPVPFSEVEILGDAYPAPGYGLPGPMFPDADPRPYVPYSWGYFGKWYVSVYPTEILTMEYGIICLNWIGHGLNRCKEIGFENYYPETKTLLYSSDPDKYFCDKTWQTIYVSWLGQFADIRTPDIYPIECVHLPIALFTEWVLGFGL